MTPAGLTESDCLFNPLVLLLRELRRTDPNRREVFFAGDSEISLCCTLPNGATTIGPNINLINDQQNQKPVIRITGDDDEYVSCRFVRVRCYEQGGRRNIMEVVFTPEIGHDLNLVPTKTSGGLKLPQIKTVILVISFSSFEVSNPDFLRGSGRPLRKVSPSGG